MLWDIRMNHEKFPIYRITQLYYIVCLCTYFAYSEPLYRKRGDTNKYILLVGFDNVRIEID